MGYNQRECLPCTALLQNHIPLENVGEITISLFYKTEGYAVDFNPFSIIEHGGGVKQDNLFVDSVQQTCIASNLFRTKQCADIRITPADSAREKNCDPSDREYQPTGVSP